MKSRACDCHSLVKSSKMKLIVIAVFSFVAIFDVQVSAELEKDQLAAAINKDLRGISSGQLLRVGQLNSQVGGRTPLSQRNVLFTDIDMDITKDVEVGNEENIEFNRAANGDATIELDLVSKDATLTAQAAVRRLLKTITYDIRGEITEIKLRVLLKYKSDTKAIKVKVNDDDALEVGAPRITASSSQTRFGLVANLVSREASEVFQSELEEPIQKFLYKFVKSSKWSNLKKLLESQSDENLIDID